MNIQNTQKVLVDAVRIYSGWHKAYADDQKISWTEAIGQIGPLINLPSTIEAAKEIGEEAFDEESYTDEEIQELSQAVAKELPDEMGPSAQKITVALMRWILATVRTVNAIIDAV